VKVKEFLSANKNANVIFKINNKNFSSNETITDDLLKLYDKDIKEWFVNSINKVIVIKTN